MLRVVGSVVSAISAAVRRPAGMGGMVMPVVGMMCFMLVGPVGPVGVAVAAFEADMLFLP